MNQVTTQVIAIHAVCILYVYSIECSAIIWNSVLHQKYMYMYDSTQVTLICATCFIIIQVFRGCWYHICVPIWWGLVVYAALELVLIYTYQFDSISDAWKRAYNDTPHVSVDAEDL